MIEMERAVTTDSAPDIVFAYLADFTTTEQWDPGSVRTERIAGDGGVGTRYENTSRFAGRTTELIYEVVAFTPGESIELIGRNRSVIAHDRITVRPHNSGSEVTYRVTFEFLGRLRWVEPILRLAVTNLVSNGARGLERELERL